MVNLCLKELNFKGWERFRTFQCRLPSSHWFIAIRAHKILLELYYGRNFSLIGKEILRQSPIIYVLFPSEGNT